MLEITSYTFGPFETNTYVVRDEHGHVLLIDPACFSERDREVLAEALPDNPQSLRIVATHGHLDHLWGARWATERWGQPVLLAEEDHPMAEAMQQQYDMFGLHLQAHSFPMAALSEASLLPFSATILRTPGHTPGSVCLYFPQDAVLFSGDTLFRCGYGRTDLPGGSYTQLIGSLQQLFLLPPATRVYPGHGEATTIGAEQ